MKKRILSAVLVVVILVCLSVSAFATQDDVSVVINNQEVKFTASSGKPFVDANGRTQVPLRVVMEQYGCDVEWDGENNAAVITRGNTTVIVPIGQPHILVNNKTVAMDTAALVQNGRTYLPIRAVLEAFGADVKWNDGVVAVSSPVDSEFENIYIDEDGNLIFELSNGNKINVGSVSNGKDGKDGKDGSDGVSVTDAYVDASGNLMIVLSSGRTINAGNVGVGGSMSGLTFADYAVGTKFYMTQPVGAFDVTINVDNVPYVVEFDSVYYELTAKNDYDDADAWEYKNGRTEFHPFEVTMFINGQTDTALEGKSLNITLNAIDTSSWSYNAMIDAEGGFAVAYTQGFSNTVSWYAPKTLFLKSISISGASSDSKDKEIADLLAKAAGTWGLPAEPDKTLIVREDGTLTLNGIDYTPTYSIAPIDDRTLIARFNNTSIEFFVDGNQAYVGGSNGGNYFRIGTWESVTLTKDNFFTYYEYNEEFRIRYNAFGEYDGATLFYSYKMKDEYASRILKPAYSTASAKIKADYYYMEYTIDFENESCVVIEPGMFYRSEVRAEDASSDATYIQLGIVNLYTDSTPPNTAQFVSIELNDAIGTLHFHKNP